MGNGSKKSNAVLYAGPAGDTREQVRALLVRDKFRVVDAADCGDDIVDAIEREGARLVLVDDGFQGQTSIRICERIRESIDHEAVSILLLADTRTYNEALLDTAFAAGATDIIGIPLSTSVFMNRVHRLLSENAAMTEMRASEAKSDVLINAIPDSMLILGGDGDIVQFMPGADEKFLRRLRRGRRSVFDYLPKQVANHWRKLQREVLETGKAASTEFGIKHPVRGKAYYQARFVPYVDDLVLVIATEVTARKRAEQRIHRLAFYDTLTGLPNRQFFSRHLQSLIDASEESGDSIAVMFIDLDNFKRINDNLGHTYGDGVLKAIAERLAGCVRSENAGDRNLGDAIGIARLGGDEFVCALTDFKSHAMLSKIAERIRNTLREPVEYRGHEFVVTPSVGVTVYPDDGLNVEDLLKNADVAMYQAKDAGRNSVRFYSGTMTLKAMRRLELEGGLRRAIDQGGLELHYQPKHDLSTGEVVGMEALVRWRDDEGNFIPPAHFIPLAEESGLITPLGEWVLCEAARQVRRWIDKCGVEMQVAVNISGQQFFQSDLRNVVMQTLFDAHVRPNLLQLELTESLLMRDVKDTIDCLQSLKDAGVSLAVDDFGTGYSSLSYLKRFPIDMLKIDRSFVAELEANNDDAAICAAIIAMAHQLGLVVVAEGIETPQQLEYLRDQGCQLGQGYLLGKPVAAAEATAVISSNRDNVRLYQA